MAQALRVKQRLLVQPKPLTVRAVYQTIMDMSRMKGSWVAYDGRGWYIWGACFTAGRTEDGYRPWPTIRNY